jgi:cyclopropane fatty-acyl-phospholipid synthase-like methyltransferase
VPASLCDLGCGYGALSEYLKQNAPLISYHGVDISHEMIDAARKSSTTLPSAQFSVRATPPGNFDYTVASGIFNVRGKRSDAEWKEYIETTITEMNKASARGIAFNCLTKYSDHDRMVQHLYYADPCAFFDFCKRNFSRNVALLHDYELYEFTILVRK